VRAIGAYLGGFAVWSTEPGVWTQEPLTFSTGNEKGFWDLTYAEGMFYACGFDDGGPPYALFLDHTAATGWRPTAGPPPAFNRELRALSSGAPGVLLVGGTDADYSSVPTRLHARLFHRATSGDWAEFVLPEPESLQRVNAILRASDNATYLGCGVEATGAVIRAGDAGITATGAVPGPVLALAEAGSGEIYAVGTRQSGESTTVFLLRRGSE